MNELTHIDLFSGIGGFALACRWNGIKTVQFVEIDKFCHKVLQKNFPGVPIHDDITTFAISESRESGEQTESEGRKDIGGRNSEVFLLTGGFPCQPFSCAGKRKGTDDSRHLWPHMLRVIKEFKPKWIIGENVAGIINIKSMEQQDSESDLESETLDEGSDSQPSGVLLNILSDLEQAGYSVQIFVIPACAVNAPHRRDRVWIVGHSNGTGTREQTKDIHGWEPSKTIGKVGFWNVLNPADSHAPNTETERLSQSRYESKQYKAAGRDRVEHADREDVSNSESKRLEGSLEADGSEGKKSADELMHGCCGEWSEPWLEVATHLCRMDDGVSEELYKLETSDRVGRLKALGNAIVPQVADQIIKEILKVENING